MTPLTRADVERLLAAYDGNGNDCFLAAGRLRRLSPDIARQLLASMEENEWRTIDSAPKDGTPVLLLIDGHVREGVWDPSEFDPATDDVTGNWQLLWAEGNAYGCGPNNRPTHWRPLPSPPTPKG